MELNAWLLISSQITHQFSTFQQRNILHIIISRSGKVERCLTLGQRKPILNLGCKPIFVFSSLLTQLNLPLESSPSLRQFAFSVPAIQLVPTFDLTSSLSTNTDHQFSRFCLFVTMEIALPIHLTQHLSHSSLGDKSCFFICWSISF